MNLGAFACVIAVARRTRSAEISSLRRARSRRCPASRSLMTIFLFSLAGIPPLAGWFAKFVMFRAVSRRRHAVGRRARRDRRGDVGGRVLLLREGRRGQMWFHEPSPELADTPTTRRRRRARRSRSASARVVVVVVGVYPQFFARVGELAFQVVADATPPPRPAVSRERIHREGPVPFDDVRRGARSTAPDGFFAQGRGAGRAGRDFVTSPEVGPLFGALRRPRARRLVARARPTRPVRRGRGGRRARPPGRRRARAPRRRASPALRYVLVERSDALRAAQRELPRRSSRSRTRSARPCSSTTTTRPDARSPAPGPIVTSLDELPAVARRRRRARQRAARQPAVPTSSSAPSDGWREVRVGARRRAVRRGAGAAPTDARGRGRPASPRRDVADGTRLPVPTGAARVARRVRARAATAGSCCSSTTRAGVAELVGAGADGWLRTYRGHARGGDAARRTRARRTSPPTSRSSTSSTSPPGRVRRSSPTRPRPSGCASLGIDELVAEARTRVGRRRRTSATSRRSPAAAAVTEAAALTDPTGLGAHRVLVVPPRLRAPRSPPTGVGRGAYRVVC